jgi:hypothetical protein
MHKLVDPVLQLVFGLADHLYRLTIGVWILSEIVDQFAPVEAGTVPFRKPKTIHSSAQHHN